MIEQSSYSINKSAFFSPKYFKKRNCICFVKNSNNGLCSGCQRPESEHYHQKSDPNFEWNYRDCTVLSATDGYGVLNFPGSHTKSAKYIRVEIETRANDILDYMFDSKGWNMQPPRLILSVTGGAQKFNIPYQMRQAFKRGLVKIATTTGAWIITGGTNTGVMRLVGEAVSEEFYSIQGTKIVILGIATWGKIALREKMIRKKRKSNFVGIEKQSSFDSDEQENALLYAKNVQDENKSPLSSKNDVFLDPNHTHFVLVDDGSAGSFGKEIDFRTRFEDELRKKNNSNSFVVGQDESNGNPNIPMLLIVVNGGPNTLTTVENTLMQKIPILVLAESKGCADIIAKAYYSKESQNPYKKIIEESNLFEKYKATNLYTSKVDRAVTQLKNILNKKQYINIFTLENEQDIEMAILRSLLELNKNQNFENFKIALEWNRYDVADSYIFTGEEDFSSEQLAMLMETALIQNKPKFVKILLDNGLDLKSFLTTKRLLFLYNSQNINLLSRKAPLFRLFKRKYLPQKNLPVITFEGISKFLKDLLFEDFKAIFLLDLEGLDLDQIVYFLKNAEKIRSSNFSWPQMDEAKFSSKVQYAEKNLFVWAILMNRVEIAKIFWHQGDYQISKALFACNMYKSFSQNLNDFEEEFTEIADYFEEMACGVFDICDDLSIDFINSIILLQNVPYYNINCLKMAYEAKCLKFISLPSVQNLLTDIWHGKMEIKNGLKASLRLCAGIFSLGILAPFLMFRNRTRLPKPSNFNDIFEDLNISNMKKIRIGKILDKFFVNDGIYLNKNEPDPRHFKKQFGSKLVNYDSPSNNDYYHKSVNKDSDDESDFDEDGDEFAEENFFGKDEKNIIEALSFDQENIKSLTNIQLYWKRYRHFIDSPRVHFIYETIFYLTFLVLFSYMILCNFQYSEKVVILINETNYTSESVSSIQLKKPAFTEYLVVFWILMYFLEESRQLLFLFGEKELKYKFKRYFSDSLNYLDTFGCLIFFIGFIFRIVSIYSNDIFFKIAKLFYAIDLTIWYLRLLNVATIFKPLGPKLVMIKKMIYDLLFFLIVIIIFVLPFGITTQATMYPEQEFNLHLLVKMINKAYWPIYGEMKILDELTEEDEDSSIVPDSTGKFYSYISLMIYMIIANVLLLNLLIAMFSSTYDLIQNKADQIWKFQRYKLVFDYYDSSVFTPPFSPFAIISSMIQNYVHKKKMKNSENDAENETLNIEKIFSEEYHRKCRKIERNKFEFKIEKNGEKIDVLGRKFEQILKIYQRNK